MVMLLAAAFLVPGSMSVAAVGVPHSNCPVQQQSCRHIPTFSCCAGNQTPDPATPAQPNEASSGRIDIIKLVGPVSAIAVSALSTLQSTSDLRAYSPPHGHQSVDLHTLYVTFLI